MTISECPGVNAKWQKRMKTWYKGLRDWLDVRNPDVSSRLEFYVENGFEKGDKGSAISCYGLWIGSQLYKYADLVLYDVEGKGTATKDGCFDTSLAMRAYSAHYLGTIRELMVDQCNRAGLPRTALGIILGCGKPAIDLARAVIRHGHKYYLIDPDSELINRGPVTTFLQVILADYLEEPLFAPRGTTLKDSVLAYLAQHWRDCDPATIVEACLKVCDYHTHGEAFTPDSFTYMPVEILLILKLRQLLGLENPQLDHPIMNTPLGKLPEEVPFQYDDLIGRVRTRMIKEGFDETIVFGNDEWCKLRRSAAQVHNKEAIPFENQALLLADQASPNSLRVFNGLRSLGALHRLESRPTEAAAFLERALSIADQNPECDAKLICHELVGAYRDLGRTADAEALLQKLA